MILFSSILSLLNTVFLTWCINAYFNTIKDAREIWRGGFQQIDGTIDNKNISHWRTTAFQVRHHIFYAYYQDWDTDKLSTYMVMRNELIGKMLQKYLKIKSGKFLQTSNAAWCEHGFCYFQYRPPPHIF